MLTVVMSVRPLRVEMLTCGRRGVGVVMSMPLKSSGLGNGVLMSFRFLIGRGGMSDSIGGSDLL